MKHFRFLLLYVFDKSFRFWFKEALTYALISHDKNRGDLAGDVLIFYGRYRDKIFTDKEQNHITELTQKYKSPLSFELTEILKRFVEQNSECKSTEDIFTVFRAKRMLEENTIDVDLNIIDTESQNSYLSFE